MHADVLEPSPRRERGFLALAVVMSLAIHVLFARQISTIQIQAPVKQVWVDMAMVTPTAPETPEPPPPPPPEPEPPPPPPPKPKVVRFQQTSKDPPPQVAPPDAPVSDKPVRRVVQGLSNQSFVEGMRTGLTVRAGTTTATAAGPETMEREDATEHANVPYSAVASAPKAAGLPPLSVPEALRTARITGRVEAEITVSAEGRVTAVTIVKALHPAADEACRRYLLATRWKPGVSAGGAVTVTGVPFTCRFEQLD